MEVMFFFVFVVFVSPRLLVHVRLAHQRPRDPMSAIEMLDQRAVRVKP